MSKTFKEYGFEYDHQGSAWCFSIHATSLEDARQRLHRLPLARHLGEIVLKVPAGGGWFVKLLCWSRNTLERLRAYTANEEPRW